MVSIAEIKERIDLDAALWIAFLLAFAAGMVITPWVMRKLRRNRIVGRDKHKPGEPEVPEMGGLAVYLAFNIGVISVFALTVVHTGDTLQVLAALLVAAGASLTGVLDDLITIRQRLKAFVPFAFAVPLAIVVPTTTVAFPFGQVVDFGLLYFLFLVPVGVACACNGFNMLEGVNGLGASMGAVIAAALSVLAVLNGVYTGLIVLLPLLGALLAFLVFNVYPSRVFPGDTMTLLVGAVLATGAILSKVEFWGALLFLPYMWEFGLKAMRRFPSRYEWAEYRDGKLYSPASGPVGIYQIVLRLFNGLEEWKLLMVIVTFEIVLACAVIVSFVAFG